LVFRNEIVLAILVFRTKIVRTVLVFRTEAVFTVLIFLTDTFLTVFITPTEIRFSEFKANNPSFVVSPGTIVGISAAYYAAKGAKIDCSKGVLASEAHALFKARKDELVANCPPEDAEAPVSDKKVAQEIANVIIFCELFEQLVHPESEIFFRRNWELGGVPFITTWSAGHFLQHLNAPPLPPTAQQPAAADKEALSANEKGFNLNFNTNLDANCN
jgi:hypothetical protein